MTSVGTERAKASARELAANRARKLRYRGTCETCGAPTSGCNGRAKAAKRCRGCAAQEHGLRLRGRGPLTEKALAFCETPRRRREIREHLGITTDHVGNLVHFAVRFGFLERLERGVYKRV